MSKRNNGNKFTFVKATNSSIHQPSAEPDELIRLTLTGKEDLVRNFLILHSDMVNYKEEVYGSVALHVAASKNFVSIMELLIRYGANLDIQDYHGNTPLLYAVDKERIPAIETLIRHGCKINMPDFKGNTPLHSACRTNNVDIVKLLLKNGADPDRYDYLNFKPVQRARLYEIVEIIDSEIKRRQNKDSSSQQIVNYLGMGIGLGIGLGVTIAKQQQQAYEYKLSQELNKNSKNSNYTVSKEVAAVISRKSIQQDIRATSLNNIQNLLKKKESSF